MKTFNPKKIISIAWMIAMTGFSFGQSRSEQGDKLFDQFAYSDAIGKYEKAIKKHPESYELWSNLK